MTTSGGSRQIAANIGALQPRQLLVVEGTIVAAGSRRWRRGWASTYDLDDGTGVITLVFGGKRAIPGMVVGMRCRVTGTGLPDPSVGTLVLWNPLYEFLGKPDQEVPGSTSR